MPPETNNLRLKELYAADQKDREKVYTSNTDVSALKTRDQQRRKELLDMIGSGAVNTSDDMYHAAVLFLHGATPKEFLTAHRLAVMAAINGYRPSRWLAAASLDRFLMSVGQPQVYSTQFEHNEEDNRYQLRLPIDDAAVLHFEKRFFGIPPVIERLAQLNRRIAS